MDFIFFFTAERTFFQGQKLRDGLRRGISYAVQWYDNLRLSLEDKIDSAIQQRASLAADTCSRPPAEVKEKEESLKPGKCASILRSRCPACFGESHFGRPLSE
jgi:hypothetical protein